MLEFTAAREYNTLSLPYDTVRGAIGTTVTLAIKRPGSSEAVSVSLTRQPTAKLTGPGITPAKQRTVSADGDRNYEVKMIT